MLRRIGYTIGLLFVVACVAAYPLTWGKVAVFRYDRLGWCPWGQLTHGHVSVGAYLSTTEGAYDGLRTLVVSGEFAVQYLYVTRYEPIPPTFKVRGGTLTFPTWLPALPVSLFMAWRWRRSRRRVAAGFEVERLHQ
jgi:hypothetical protein